MIHIRCKTCHQYLAGPLTLSPPGSRSDLGLTEYFETGNNASAVYSVLDFTQESEADLLIHAQWYDSWSGEWPDRCDGAHTRMMFILPTGAYGCCGPAGGAKCSCGAELGRVWADCIGPHCILLYDQRIERSDRIDGRWTLLADADRPIDWIETVGELRNGQRHGDWECWYNSVTDAAIRKRNKTRELVQATNRSVTRSQFRLEAWDHGTLVSAVDAAGQRGCADAQGS